MLSFNFTAVVNIIGFILFMVFMYKLLYKPYFDMTDKRKQEVEKNLNEAERLRTSAQEDKDEAEKQLKKLKEEKEDIINKARDQAKAIEKEAKNNALEERERLLIKAEKEAEEIKEKSKEEIQNQIMTLSVLIASNILKEKIDTKINEEMVRRAIGNFESKGDFI